LTDKIQICAVEKFHLSYENKFPLIVFELGEKAKLEVTLFEYLHHQVNG
jgi:hypothetical protein